MATDPAYVGIALALAALAMFSANIVITRFAIARVAVDVGFAIAVAINVVVGALAFAGELVVRRSPLEWHAGALAMFVAAGAFTTYLGRWFFFETVRRLGPARASTFQISSPLFTALVAWIALGERISPVVLGAMAVVVVGLYLVSVPRGDGAGAARERVRALLRSGIGIGVASSFAYAIGNVLRGAAMHRWPEPVLGALLGAASGAALHFALSPPSRRLPTAIARADRRGVALYAVCGTLTIVAQMLTIASMSYIAVSIAALITLCSPLIVFPASYLLLANEERITVRIVLGSAIALAGIAVIVLR